MPKSEIDSFFEGLPSEDKKLQDVFGDKAPEEIVAEVAPEKEPEERKNRRQRRIEEQLRSERDANIALTERVKVLAEQKALEREAKADGTIDPDLLRVFGTTDEGKEIARIMSSKIDQATTAAEDRALQRFAAQQAQLIEEQKKHESEIDSQLESLEDAHNIDLTSNAPAAKKARSEFLELVQSISPKDEKGQITAYADFDNTFDLYQKMRTKETPPSRAKEIADRSMQRSGQVDSLEKTVTPGFGGWRKDYGLE